MFNFGPQIVLFNLTIFHHSISYPTKTTYLQYVNVICTDLMTFVHRETQIKFQLHYLTIMRQLNKLKLSAQEKPALYNII